MPCLLEDAGVEDGLLALPGEDQVDQQLTSSLICNRCIWTMELQVLNRYWHMQMESELSYQ